MSRLFISHASANNAQALALARWLADNGWDDWFLDISADRGIAPGERWQQALKAAAQRCEAVLFLISPAWLASTWSRAEFLLAKQLDKAVFGLLIDNVPLDGIPREMTAEWQLCDLVQGAERTSWAVAQDPIVARTYVSFATAGLTRLRLGLQKTGLDPSTFPWPPPNDPERAPYRGLRALEAEDAAIFFGREGAIVRGLDALRGMRERGVEQMLVVLGASGAGKSSFLRAGLLPRLERDDRNFLPLPVIRPERAAISGATGLAAALEGAFRRYGSRYSRADVRAVLDTAGGLDALLGELQALAQARLGPGAPAPTVVVAVDQGEELYGTEGGAESDAFLALLAGSLALDDSALRRALCVVAIRSDSYERLQIDGRVERVTPLLFDLPPIARGEFKAVIEQPAVRHTAGGHRLDVEPTLAERLLRDAEGADALPLLAFTMERLFVECGGDGDLRLAEYEALGGVRGSIEKAVDAAFVDPGRAPAVPADTARRAELLRQGFIPWLVRVDPDTEERKRRVARWEELPVEARPLLERLVEQRLLVRDRRRLDGGETEAVVVEVAHEALLRQWSALGVWLDEDAAELKALDGVERAAAEWVKNGQATAWLAHTGDRLAQAERLRQRPDFERRLGLHGAAYLAACRQRDDAARTEREAQVKRVARLQRRIGVALAVVALVIAGAGGWIVMESRAVGRQTSLVLADLARREATEHMDRALRLAELSSRDGWLAPAEPEGEGQLASVAHAVGFVGMLAGHERRVTAAAFSPNGRRVITASWDSTARLWDATTGQALATLAGHDGAVSAAAFSPDGHRIVTASSDNTARLWDATTGQALAILAGHDGAVSAAAFSPDGRRIVTASNDKTARLWDATTGQVLATLAGHDGVVSTAAFSPDGHRIVTASSDNTARLWDATSGQALATLAGHDGVVSAAAFSPDGRRVVITSFEQTRLWDAATGQALVTLAGHDGSLGAAAFSPDGRRVVTASDDGTARLWDAANGQALITLAGHEDIVRAATFSPDGRRIVTASDDGMARLWDATTGQALATLAAHEDAVLAAAFSPDGRRVVTASDDGTARLWDATTGQALATLAAHEDAVLAVAFSPDGRRIVTASFGKRAHLWDMTTGQSLATLAGHEDAVGVVAFSPDGRRVVTASDDRTARLWDAATGQALATLAGHEKMVRAAAFSPDGRRVVTASDDRTARLWDATTGQALATLAGHDGVVSTAGFSPDGRRVVTASRDKTARLWNATTGQALATLAGHDGVVSTAGFSPDGRRVVTASSDKTARLWDATTGQALITLTGHQSGVGVAAFSPDGRRIVTASSDKTARLWNATTGQALSTLAGHKQTVFTAAFSPDGRRIVTASSDKTARLWDAATGQALATLARHETLVSAAAFSPDGRRVVTASWDGTALLWDVHWLTQYYGAQLRSAVCAEKLLGAARILTQGDVAAAPILRGREGEDVCASWWSNFVTRTIAKVRGRK